MAFDKRYFAKCDICGRVKRQAFDFFSIPDRERLIGICKECAKKMYHDEDEDLEYFANTANLCPINQKKVANVVKNPPVFGEQISLFGFGDLL